MSALPHTLPYLFMRILLHNTAETLRSAFSHANIYNMVMVKKCKAECCLGNDQSLLGDLA